MVLFIQTQFLDIFEPIIDTHFSDRVFAGDKPVREIIPIVIVLGSKNTSEASWHHSNKALVVGSIQAWRNWGWFRIYLSCSNDALRVDLEWFSQSMQEEQRRTWLNSGKSWSKETLIFTSAPLMSILKEAMRLWLTATRKEKTGKRHLECTLHIHSF